MMSLPDSPCACDDVLFPTEGERQLTPLIPIQYKLDPDEADFDLNTLAAGTLASCASAN